MGRRAHRGIDCSGLIRRGLIDAYVNEGIAGANPRLLRQAFSLWWHDSSARALKDGHLQQANLLSTTSSINDLDPAALQPGDFAVTSDGIHALAYLGDRTWIEADPSVWRVIQVKTPSPDNAWFGRPVHLMRWRVLG